MTLKVSIIVPIYNQEAYLQDCLNSLTKQTYQNLDIVLVDDGSMDASYQICSNYARHDDRIQLIHQENQGLVGATITGIKYSKGDYIAFVDSDDYITEDFIENFVMNNDSDYDMIASGFFIKEPSGIVPYELSQTRDYEKDEISQLRQNFLMKRGQISKDIFVSRWNKFFNAEKVKAILPELEQCKAITLGEDTLFNYLFLTVADRVRIIQDTNGYVYNRSNLTSMTAQKDAEKWLATSYLAYQQFTRLIRDGSDAHLPSELYYLLTENLFNSLKDSKSTSFAEVYHFLQNDSVYQQAVKTIWSKLSRKQQVQASIRKICSRGGSYLKMLESLKRMSFARRLMAFDVKNTLETMSFQNPIRSYYQMLFNRRRYTAYRDLERDLPLLEERLVPILDKYRNRATDLESSPIVKNIFVMWWDGFAQAPELVQSCLNSVRRFYDDYEIVEIDQWNYQQFTDIDRHIIQNFNKGKISIQTFSDILRFNLLKNNGGIWLDATIFFSEYYPLIEGLEFQSFHSIEFSTSREFLTYKGERCSWSGFCIASRKNGLLVTAMDELFREYYLTYNSYQNYFFIDSALMICKLLKIDGDVLSKTSYHPESMFSLAKLLDRPYHHLYDRQVKVLPQKLIWSLDTHSMPDDSCYAIYIKGGENSA